MTRDSHAEGSAEPSVGDAERNGGPSRGSDDRNPGPSRRGFLARTAAVGVLAGGFSALALGQETTPAETIVLGGEIPGWQGIAPESIAGQTNPTLELTEGERYRVVWQNLDGQPHNFALQDAQGANLPVIEPAEISVTEADTLLGNATNVTLNTSVGNVTANETTGNVTGNATTGNVTGNATTGNVTGNATAGAGAAGRDQSTLLFVQGAVQVLEFTATAEMATYICLVHPTSMKGDVRVGTGGGAGNNSTG